MTEKGVVGFISKSLASLLVVGLMVVAGCGQGTTTPKVAKDSKAFDTAAAELKDQWSTILSAASTNDYTTAILTCRKLTGDPALTAEQRAAINATLAAESNKMFDAAQKGDTAAQQAVADVRKGWR